MVEGVGVGIQPISTASASTASTPAPRNVIAPGEPARIEGLPLFPDEAVKRFELLN